MTTILNAQSGIGIKRYVRITIKFHPVPRTASLIRWEYAASLKLNNPSSPVRRVFEKTGVFWRTPQTSSFRRARVIPLCRRRDWMMRMDSLPETSILSWSLWGLKVKLLILGRWRFNLCISRATSPVHLTNTWKPDLTMFLPGVVLSDLTIFHHREKDLSRSSYIKAEFFGSGIRKQPLLSRDRFMNLFLLCQ